MNKTIGWIVGVIVVLVLGYWAYSAMDFGSPTAGNGNNTSKELKGNIVVSFTDDTAAIFNVNEISLKVDKLELYSSTRGWVIVSTNDAEYKLLALKAKGETMIYATAALTADNYTQARLTIESVTMDTKGNGPVVASVPNKVMTFETDVKVKADAETSLKFDVLADRSTHITAENEYVFAPVVKVESRSNATVETSVTGLVTVSGGMVDSSNTIGMDLDGNSKAGFELDASTKLDVGATGVINILKTI